MAVKLAFIVQAPDGDPSKHRSTIKTSKAEMTTIVVERFNFDQAEEVCKELAQDGIDCVFLCPGFSHKAVARMADVLGDKVAIDVARGDGPAAMIMGQLLAREQW